MKTRLRLVAGLIAASALVPAVVAPAVAGAAAPSTRCTGVDALPSATNLPAIRRSTLCLLNVERRKAGRASLRFNRDLAKAANGYAGAMVHQHFFDHVSPGGLTFVQRIGKTSYLDKVSGWNLGENLAWGGGDLSSPRQTVSAWMHSAGHKRNILDRHFTEIGIGVALGTPSEGSDGATYATEFGRRS